MLFTGSTHQCGTHLSSTHGQFGSFDSDSDGYYDNFLSCKWTLMTVPGYILQLFLEDFAVEYDEWCRYDYLMVGSLTFSHCDKYFLQIVTTS